VPPQAVMFGYRGHVDFEFWVERDGRVTDLKMLKSTGTPSLDRAAQNALTSSRPLALPADYRPARIRMQIAFYYNEAPQS
jgi:TonB family protein